MGLLRKAGNALKGEVSKTYAAAKNVGYNTPEAQQERQRRKAIELQRKQELWEIRDKAKFEQQKKTAAAVGKKQGAQGGAFSGGGVMGFGRAMESSLNNTEKAFGFGGGFNMGSNIFDGPAPPKKPVPQRVTRISKSGTVTITEPAGAGLKAKPKREPSPYDWMNDVNNFLE